MKKSDLAGHQWSIRTKISIIVLFVSALAVFFCMAVSFWGINQTKVSTVQSSSLLGQMAAVHSEKALIHQAEVSLLEQARERAALAQEKLSNISEQVVLLSEFLNQLYSEKNILPYYTVDEPDAGNAGKWALQYGLVEGIPYDIVKDEINTAGNLVHLVKPLCENRDTISSLYFASVNGFMISFDKDSDNMFQDKPEGAPPELLANQYDPRNTEWFQSAEKEGKPVFTKTYLDAFGRLLISAASPVYDGNGKLAGVAAMDILIEDINEEIVNANVGKGGFAFLFDNDGEIVVMPEINTTKGVEGDNGQNYQQELYGLVKQLTVGKDGIHVLQFDGEAVFTAYATVENTGWRLALTLPRDEVVAPAAASHETILKRTDEAINSIDKTIKTMLAAFIFTLIVVVIGVAFAANFFSKWLTAPILQLMEDVHIISRGQLSHVVTINTHDEVEDLGLAFNHMTASLTEYMRKLALEQGERERIETELTVANSIQASMLPCIFPPFPERKEFMVFADMNPAREVGGDFYDFFMTDHNHLWLVIADVSGKGVPAALFMVIAKTMLKNHAAFEASPARVMTLVNDQLCDNNEAGMFVTVFMGVLEISTGCFIFTNAGHNPPLLCRCNGQFDWIRTEPSFVLAGLKEMSFFDDSIKLFPGDKLFLYTDGVTEALNCNGELYGEDRLIQTLNKPETMHLTAENLILHMKENMKQFAGQAEQADDITMMAIDIQEEKQ